MEPFCEAGRRAGSLPNGQRVRRPAAGALQ
ncbi:hypothetical protein Y027_4026 [Burkholderia pseudomallei TSV5]|nr:hypothetical protein Y043_5156 [Burkholderia pseudomallei MSHR2138]KGX55515.1 hypothetical protein Y027_4026 [Burkholderia pseudomallei TSV5]